MPGRRTARTAAALLFACALLAPARGDEFVAPAKHHYHTRHVYQHAIILPPERHVIEVVRGAYSTNFIINGIPFRGQNACAFGWAAGQHVALLEGSWHGACAQAVFYNVPLRQTCALLCPNAGERLLNKFWFGY